MEQVLPNSVVLGSPQSGGIYCLMMLIFFTVLAVLLFILLTRNTAFKREWREVYGNRIWTLSKVHGALVVLPIWLLSCGWFYNATLGDRFFEVRRNATPVGVAWEFGYAYPLRFRPVSDKEIKTWTGQVGWERRTFRHSLYVELQNGRVLRSASLHPKEFAEKAAILERWGIKVLPPATNAPPGEVAKPH